ncbi:hypothetical protein OC844_007642, partial [Tilletia horrida]
MADPMFKCSKPNCSYATTRREDYAKHWKRHSDNNEPFPIPSRKGQRATDRNSQLWISLKGAWNALPHSHPQLPRGAAILAYFAAKRTQIQSGLTSDIYQSFTTNPGLSHLINDALYTNITSTNGVSNCGTLISTSTGSPAPHLTKGDLLASFIHMVDKPASHSDFSKTCAILNAAPAPDGSQLCQLRVADCIKHLGTPKTTTPESSTAFTPRGHITDIHIDSFYEAT